MKVSIKIGEVEVTIAEEHQLTKRSYDEDMHLKCKIIAQELYEKYMQNRKTEDGKERLQKKLDIATNSLKEYAKGDSNAGNGCSYETPAPSLSQKALKEIEEV